MTSATVAAGTLTVTAFIRRLHWLDGTPLIRSVEPYRMRIFEQFFDPQRPYNLALTGRGKKNWKSADLAIAALFALVVESQDGHDSDCYILANDADQARDDLNLVKKLIKVNPALQDWLTVRRDIIERKDGRGFLEILPAGDVVGQHGKSYRFTGYDEIHGYRNWDVMEAMQPDPHRLDAQQWITSYASLFHRPGVPLFDLTAIGKTGTDPRMLFSWYAANFTTDPDFADRTPEERANPSMGSWADSAYLAQQQRRLPAHKYRRLHLNLPGLPEGSAYQPEPVMDAVTRGESSRKREEGVTYAAFVDMSGGSSDDAVIAIGHKREDRFTVDRLVNQGPPPPFDPRKAVARFEPVLREYGISRVTGDKYAGETFIKDFESRGIKYDVAAWTKSEIYEALEPRLNAREIALPDVPLLEQQLLGLVWRGAKIDHQPGEHDDWANAAAGVVQVLGAPARRKQGGTWGPSRRMAERMAGGRP